MKTKISLTIIIFITLVCTLLLGEDDKIPSKFMKDWVGKEKDNCSEIIFYGKVIDQYDKPLVDANVTLKIRVVTLIPKPDPVFELKTDSNGQFIFKGPTGGSLYIKNIVKDGYVYLADKSENGFEYRKDRTMRHIPDPGNPMIFHMRKRGDNPTYLMINSNFDLDLSSGEKVVLSFVDLKNDWEGAYKDGNYDKDFLSKNYDIKVSAAFDMVKSDWTVTFSANGENGGFILEDRFLSEAPENGYAKEFKIIQHVATEKEKKEFENSNNDNKWDKFQKLTEFKFKGKYLYIKSRNPSIYTRMELADARADDAENVRINANTATNPYGERNLEFNDELPLNLTDVLYGRVIDSFLANKRPEKPDINKMFDEFKKTHKPVKNTYGNTVWVEIKE